MKSWSHSIHAFASSAAIFLSVCLAPTASAQNSGSETGAVQDYVARTREISTADYRIDRQPDVDGRHVYRVTIGPDVAGIVPAERVFDVSMVADGTEVLGEFTIKLAD